MFRNMDKDMQKKSDGKIIFVEPPETGYGQQVLHWVNGIVKWVM